MDLTIVLSLITAITAVTAPSITEIIRSRNSLRIKELEIYEAAKREAFSDFSEFFSHVGLFQATKAEDYMQKVLSGIYKAAIYCDPATQEELYKLVALIKNAKTEDDFEKAYTQFHICITRISALNQAFGNLAQK